MKTSMKALFLGAAASIAIVSCGGGDGKAEAPTEASASKMAKGGSPLDQPYKLSNGEPFNVETYLAGMEGQVEYGSVEFDDSLGATVITDLRPVGEGKDMSVGRIELYGVNEEAITALQSGAGLSEMTELFKKIRIYDLDGTFPAEGIMDDEGNQLTGRISFEAMEINPVSLVGGGEEGMDPGPDTVSFGGMAVKGMNFMMPFGGNGEGIDMTMPDFRVMGYSDGEFGGMYARDWSYSVKQSPEMIDQALAGMGEQAGMITQIPFLKNMLFPAQQDVKIGEMKWDGVNFANLMPYIDSGEQPPVTETDLIRIGGMEFTDTETKVNGKLASRVGKSTMDPIDFHHFMPKKVRFVSEDSVTDLTAYVGEESAEIADILRKNGLDEVGGESEMVYTFDPRSGAMKLDLSGDADGLYSMSFDMGVADFDYDAIVGGAEDGTAQGALMGAAFEGMTLELDDEKLLDTGFAIAGAILDQDPATLRQNAVGILSLGALQGGEISPRIPGYATALSSFVSEGGTLTISAKPEDAVTFGTLAASSQSGDPAALLDTLNVTVTRE